MELPIAVCWESFYLLVVAAPNLQRSNAPLMTEQGQGMLSSLCRAGTLLVGEHAAEAQGLCLRLMGSDILNLHLEV